MMELRNKGRDKQYRSLGGKTGRTWWLIRHEGLKGKFRMASTFLAGENGCTIQGVSNKERTDMIGGMKGGESYDVSVHTQGLRF